MSDPVFMALDALQTTVDETFHAARLAELHIIDLVNEGSSGRDESGRWIYQLTNDDIGVLLHAVNQTVDAADHARKALAAGFGKRRKTS